MKNPAVSTDLHLHTFYSDGRASPEEVLRHAAQIGLTTIAITDHDNVNAYPEAIPLAEKLGIELVPAIEFTSRWDGCAFPGGLTGGKHDIDVLGYFVDLQNTGLERFTKDTLEDIQVRVADCCQLLSDAGYLISIADVSAQNPRYAGAVQLIEALQHRGHVEGWRKAQALFESCWKRVRPSRFTIAQVIEAVHAAGGVAVLAHPVTVVCGEDRLDSKRLAELVEYGLDALEIYHPRLDQAARRYFHSLAKQFGLLVTGGSDEHGWPAGFPRLGSERITARMVAALREKSRANSI
jgi:3',5'-nucleoside bisphosphate phosphatase